MKIARCPVCHANIHLDQIAQDAAASELLSIFAKQSAQQATALLSYLALFRPAKSDLNNGRALRLVNEILAFTPNSTALQRALEQTATQIAHARLSGDSRPLTNHNYLLRVLHALPCWNHEEIDNQQSVAEKNAQPVGTKSKVMAAVATLDAMMVNEDE
jgi:hypothetical protein